MATIEEVKARRAAIFVAEGAALYALAERMRELAASNCQTPRSLRCILLPGRRTSSADQAT
jgi:hypothetical protein